MTDHGPEIALELLPCPFCGGPARAFRYNGTTEATCADGSLKCAGTDVYAPIAMWNRRAPSAEYRRGIEDAAKVADEYPRRDPGEDGSGYWAAEEIATAIRTLKGGGDAG